jgi:hypothetical protein
MQKLALRAAFMLLFIAALPLIWLIILWEKRHE